MQTDVRVVAFGGECVNKVVDLTHSATIDRVEITDLSDFNHGEIDWRGRLEGAHWLLLSSSTVVLGDSARSAQGAGMTFAEFEGPRVAMIVDMPEDSSRLAESWGHVVERIRQIHLIFLMPDALSRIAQIEGINDSELLQKIRLMGMVPQVCTFDSDSGRVRIEHSLGSVDTISSSESSSYWLANYLCELPKQGPGIEGVLAASKTI
ncbi:MAG: hypothetical protein ACJZ39_01370 [Candidatus Thalassarchaeaceae archaeon]|jgi:hypothetical protein